MSEEGMPVCWMYFYESRKKKFCCCRKRNEELWKSWGKTFLSRNIRFFSSVDVCRGSEWALSPCTVTRWIRYHEEPNGSVVAFTSICSLCWTIPDLSGSGRGFCRGACWAGRERNSLRFMCAQPKHSTLPETARSWSQVCFPNHVGSLHPATQ